MSNKSNGENENSTVAESGESFLTRGVSSTKLPNGLTVLTKEVHDKPIVACILWYRVGSKNEELGQTGKSHFLEHMLFKGTDKFGKGQIDLITLQNGGANNAFTWLDFTAYYFTFSSDRWDVALEIEASRMRNTTFAEADFQSEKKVVEEELSIGLDGPWETLENEVWATAYRQHPYHWPTVGWLEDLERTTAAEMKAYYDKWYHPRNATLVIVGDFDTKTTLSRIADLFSSIPGGPEEQVPIISEPPQRGEKRVTVKKATPVERLLIGYHIPAVADADTYNLHIIEAMLSTGKASRLYERLVENDRSVTLARASCEDHIDPSLFTIQAELKPTASLPEVEKAIYDEIEKICARDFTESDLQRAKNQVEADLVFSNEELLHQAILLGQYETIAAAERVDEASRGYKYLDTLLDRVRAVTSDSVAATARKYFVADNRTVGFLIDDGTAGAGGSDDYEEEEAAARQDSGARPVSSAFKGSNQVCYKTGKAASTGSVTPQGHAPSLHGESGKKEHRLTLDVEKITLPNGLTILLSENHTTPSVSIRAVVNAGSRFEPDSRAGLAALVGELLDEGTKSRASRQIAEAVESVGGKLDTFGEYQFGGIHGAFLSKDVDLGLEIASDLLRNATFPTEKVEMHLDRRLAQIKSRLDTPRVLASDVFNEIVFDGHPQHRPAIGYVETVRALTRDQFIEFYERYYVPGNTIISVVGDIDKNRVRDRLEILLGGWEQPCGFELPVIPIPVRQKHFIEKHVNAAKEQVNIYIGHLGISRLNPDYYALMVMDTVLGSSPGFTSRIPRILRDEQGLAYSTYSNITGSARLDPGRFVAYIGTSPKNLEQALTGLRKEISRIVAEPVTEDELAGAKSYLTGNFVFDFQTNGQIGQFLIDAETYHLGFDYLERYPALVRSVTVQDVWHAAKKYIDPDCLTTVVVGPVGKSE